MSVGPSNGDAHGRVLNGELIALKYPNGRIHETALDRKLAPGDYFEMYGRKWMAMSTKIRIGTSRVYGSEPRTLCVPAGSSYV